MRVATANSYDNTVSHLTRRQAELSNLQGSISTGKRVQRASDDPVAAVLSESAQNRLARVQADQRTLSTSRTSLIAAESALASAGSLMQDARDLMVSAGNGTYGDSEYQDIAQQLEGIRDQLIGVANQKDSSGRTLFGGLGGTERPFVETYSAAGNGVRFDGQRGQEATGNTTLPQSFDGHAVFMRVPPGNGSFVVSLGAANSGSAHTDPGQITNPSAVTGHSYSIAFSGAAGSMQYSVTNTTTGLPVPGQTGQPYQSGSAIEFDGLSFDVTGTPANGDTLAVASNTGHTDVFSVLQKAIVALRSTTGGASAESLQALSQSMTELDAGHDRILQARSLAGAWLNRADATDEVLADRSVALKAEQSTLEDLDMLEGISDFQNQQTGLQAALQSYAQVQRLSLFQYIG